MNDMAWKKYQFVTEIQTALIANALVGGEANTGQPAILSSARAALVEMSAVFQAAEKIPEDVTAHDAALDYLKTLLASTIEEEVDFSQLHLTS